MKKTSLYILLIIFFFNTCSISNFLPKSNLPGIFFGSIQINSEQLKKHRVIRLDGDWEFYWNQFLSESKEEDILPSTFAPVPGVWNDLKYNEKSHSIFGYATYRLKINIKNPPKSLGLHVHDSATSMRVLWNGEIVCESGKVGKTKEEYLPGYKSHLVELNPVREENILLLEIANFEHRKSGPWEEIEIGFIEDLHRSRYENFYLQMFVFGSLLIIGLYHVSLFSHTREDFTALFFGLFCTFISFHVLLMEGKLFFEILPDFNWGLALRLNYLSIYLSSYFFALFIYNLFPRQGSEYLFRLYTGIIIFFSAIIILTPVYYFSYTLIPFEISVLLLLLYILSIYIKIFVRGKKIGLVGTIGFLILLISIINDILHDNLLINTSYNLRLGILSFVFTHSYLISMRYAKSFKKIKRFFNKAKQINQKLILKNKDLEHLLEEKSKLLNQKIMDSKSEENINPGNSYGSN